MGIPPQLGSYPGQHLHRDEGLSDIVIRAHIQPQHFVLGLGLCGKQNNGGIGKFPDFGGCRNAVHDGHHHIQQNQVDIVPADNLHRLFTGKGLIKLIALRGQVDLQRVHNIRLVVTNQHIVHVLSPLSSFWHHYTIKLLKRKEERFLKSY